MRQDVEPALAPPAAPEAEPPRGLLAALNRPVIAIVAVAIIAGGLRFFNLDDPPSRVFDEVYYSKDACNYLHYSVNTCDIKPGSEQYWRDTRGETSWVHPPLGKWMIALGEKLFGVDSFGWRFSSALFGTLSVVLLAAIVQLLFGSALWTFVGGLLLATESLNFVQSRLAMLDIFVTFWVVVGFLFLVMDRRWIDRRTILAADQVEPSAPSPIWRPWRFAAGAAFGAATATKWSGALGLVPAAVALSCLWECTRRRKAATRRPLLHTITEEGFGLVMAFVIVPYAVYVASYIPWFVQHGVHLTNCFTLHSSAGDRTNDWCDLQNAMRSYHEGLHPTALDPQTHTMTPIHPYLSPAWKWLPMIRPVSYYFRNPGTEVLGMGNPAIFWGSILAIPYLGVLWLRRRDWRAGLAVVAILGMYVPWFFVSRPTFFFYVAPLTPFLVLACTFVAKDLSELRIYGSRSRPYLPVAVGFVIVSVGMFAFFYPVLTAWHLSRSMWHLRIWIPTWI